MAQCPTIDAYIVALPEAVRDVASSVRETIKKAAPGALEAMKYGMPVFQKAGASFIYFAVWKKHVGLYPIYRGTDDFEEAIGPYRVKKDTVQFPLDKPLPNELIARIVHSQLARLRSDNANSDA